jgi:hypothetical protein
LVLAAFLEAFLTVRLAFALAFAFLTFFTALATAFRTGLAGVAAGVGAGGGASGSIGVGAGSIQPESDQLISSCSSAIVDSSGGCRGVTPAAGVGFERPRISVDDKMHIFN